MSENSQSRKLDPLSRVLIEMNLESTLYFQKTFTLPWSINVHQNENVICFHIVQSGHCYVRLHSNNDSFLLEKGDIFIISQGEAHTIYNDPYTEFLLTDLNQVLHSHIYTPDESIQIDSDLRDTVTHIVCGHYAFGKEGDCSFLNALPRIIHRKNTNDDFSAWLDNTLSLCATEDKIPPFYSEQVIIKTAEIALTLALRMYLESSADIQTELLKLPIEKH